MKHKIKECCEKCITDWDSKNCDCPCHTADKQIEEECEPKYQGGLCLINCKIHLPDTEIKENGWEEEFDKLYIQMPDEFKDMKLVEVIYPILRDYSLEIKSFISSLLEQVKEELNKKWGKDIDDIVIETGEKMEEYKVQSRHQILAELEEEIGKMEIKGLQSKGKRTWEQANVWNEALSDILNIIKEKMK